jgi:WD40 repeat protein
LFTVQSGFGAIRSIAYTADGRQLVVDQPISGRDSGGPRALVWWDLRTRAASRRFSFVRTIRSADTSAHRPEVYLDQAPIDVSFCPRTNRVAVAWSWGSIEDPVCVYNLDADASECMWFPRRNYLLRVAFSPDGTRLAFATQQQQCDVYQLLMWPADSPFGNRGPYLFSRETAWDQARWLTILDEVEASAFGEMPELAFDGRFVACVWPSLRSVFVWDTEVEPDSGMERARRLPVDFLVSRLALAPSGGPQLMAGGERLAVWNADGAEMRSLDPPSDAVTALTLDSSGNRLAIGARDGTLELRHGPDWQAGPRLASGTARVTAVAFSPDGMTCATGSEDGRITVWDLAD